MTLHIPQRHWQKPGKATGKKFTSRADGYNQRRPVWSCDKCGAQHKDSKVTACTQCESPEIIFFDSVKEANHYAQLKLLQKAGQITRLRVKPKYPVNINGVTFITWRPDFDYYQGDKLVIEDVKGSKFAAEDRVFLLKKKAVELYYGTEVRVTW